jgi:hypothetical protein
LKIGYTVARFFIRTLLLASLFIPLGLQAQDERRVSSPDGQVEFRILVAQSNDGGLAQLA